MATSSTRRVDRVGYVQAPHGYYPDRDAYSRGDAYRRSSDNRSFADTQTVETATYKPSYIINAQLPCPSSPMPLKLSFDEASYTVRKGEFLTFTITLLMSNGLRIDMSRTAHLHILNPQIIARRGQEWQAIRAGETMIEAITNGMRATAHIRVLE